MFENHLYFQRFIPSVLLMFSISSEGQASIAKRGPIPIQFSISETKMVSEIPDKNRDFAFIIPGDMSTYIYKTESEYYKDYQRSYFAITRKRIGWDCMRHYEILANGCIPYFIGLEECDSNTMSFLPRELIWEAMHLEGVSYLKIDHEKFDKAKYFEILNKLMEHTRKHLTSRAMANYLLETVGYSGNGRVLFLYCHPWEDYLSDCILIGLKELLQEKVVDYHKKTYIYKNYPNDISLLHGKGFSFSKIVEDLPIDRENIEQRIRNKEFELIIYASVHRSLPFHEIVTSNYEQSKIVYLCGEDIHRCEYANYSNLFLREFTGNLNLR